jgi:hypothetical protein
MSPNEILESLRVCPFEPFRVCMTDGKYYELRHSEACMPTRTAVIIGLISDPNDPLPDWTVKVDPLQVIRLEPLETTPRK